MGTTGPPFELPYPEGSDDPDVPRDIKKLAEQLALVMGASSGIVGEIRQIIKVGTVAVVPDNWFILNGQKLQVADYPDLATLFGATSGEFALPNATGHFLRGTSSGGGGTGGSTKISAAQVPQHRHSVPAHNHTVSQTTRGAHSHILELTSGGTPGQYPQSAAASPAMSGRRGATRISGGDGNHTHSVAVSGGATNTGYVGSGSDYWQPHINVVFIIYAGEKA